MTERNTRIRAGQILNRTIELEDISPDALVWQEPILDKDLSQPPASSNEGDRYIIKSGEWSWNVEDDCSNISIWSNGDNINGESTQVTFDSKSCFKFDSKIKDTENYARRSRNLSVGADYTIEMNLYLSSVHDGGLDAFELIHFSNGSELELQFRSDGLFNGYTGLEIGTNLTQLEAWQKWRFEVRGTSSNAKLDVYLNDVLKASDITIDGLTTGAKIYLTCYGLNYDDNIAYVDYIKVGIGSYSEDWGGNHANEIAQYISNNWSYYIPQEGWFIWVKDEGKLYRYSDSSWQSFSLVEADITDLDHYDSTDFDTDFAGKDLGDLSDGTTYKKLKVDDFTIKESNNIIKVADRIELNTMLIAFRLSVQEGFTQFNMVDGIIDEYEDQSGVDDDASTGETYDSSNDLYKPTPAETLEIDYCEYSTDLDAQVNWESSKQVAGKWNIGGSFNGSSSYLRASDHADWDLFNNNSDNKTVEMWVKFLVHSGTEILLTQYEDSENYWALKHTHGSGFHMDFYKEGVERLVTSAGGEITDSDWHHIAWCKISNTYHIYVDGTRVVADATNQVDTYSGYLYIGQDGASGNWANIILDEVRIIWADPFSAGGNTIIPPVSAHTSDSDTKLLLHLDGNVTDSGDTGHTITNNDVVFVEDIVSYSEDGSGLFTQGSYSLKIIADMADSLNEYVRNTFGTGNNIDLSSYSYIKFDINASRIGTNLQMRIHDSGGTIITKDITIDTGEEETWKTITWDISGETGIALDNIDYIELKITNADAGNTIYLDNIYASSDPSNMILISEGFSAEADPETGRIIIFEQDVDSITINTDLKAYISKDDGSTWGEITLSDEGDYDNNIRILSGIVNLTQTGIGSATGYPVRYKITTYNTKNCYIHGTGINWS